MTGHLQPGHRVRLPGIDGWVTVTDAIETAAGWRVYADTDDGGTVRRDLTSEQTELLEVISEDGSADAACILAGFWAEWMRAATVTASATALATTPLRPYAHQLGRSSPSPKPAGSCVYGGGSCGSPLSRRAAASATVSRTRCSSPSATTLA